MAELVIRVRDDGPFVLEGSVTILDADGNPFAAPLNKPAIALCRCGQSARKPFCDGSHKAVRFAASERATPG